MADRLVVRGAREHNLRDVSLDLPRDRLIVFTGLSGSGKSSLAFDTIYAEGQRRYVESLSAYARQFLGQMDKPDVDFIEGLSPAISIDQKSASRNPRSTVGTITEVYDYLRLLYARVGHPHCPNCGRPVARQTPQQIVDRVLELPEGTRFQVLAPVVRGRKGEYSTLLDDLAKQGFARVRVDGVPLELAERAEVTLARYEMHTIEVVVDRLISRDNVRQRLTESIETALGLTGGTAEVLVMNGTGEAESDEAITFSQHLACTHCGISFEEPAPRSFSFNSPYGACPACLGLGTRFEVDPELVVPDESLSLAEGALAPWAAARSEYFTGLQVGVAELGHFSVDTPWKKLKAKDKKLVLYGTGTRTVHVRYKNRFNRSRSYDAHYEGIVPWLQRRHGEAESDWSREQVELYMREVDCPECHGARLKPESLAVTVGERNIFELCSLSIAGAVEAMSGLELTEREHMIADRVLKEVRERMQFLLDVGLDYLSLARSAGTLSGGRHSGSVWPARSAAASSACSTCSTSPPSACTSGTTSGSSPRSSACATWATPSSWWSTTRRPFARPTTWSTSVLGRESTVEPSFMRGLSPAAADCSRTRRPSPGSTFRGSGRSLCRPVAARGPAKSSPSVVRASTTCMTSTCRFPWGVSWRSPGCPDQANRPW